MNVWRIGEAKQRFSEVVRLALREPQIICNRDRRVAVVLSSERYEEFERWREDRNARTLASEFSEVREICAEEDYELEYGERQDRDSWITDG